MRRGNVHIRALLDRVNEGGGLLGGIAVGGSLLGGVAGPLRRTSIGIGDARGRTVVGSRSGDDSTHKGEGSVSVLHLDLSVETMIDSN